MSQQELNDREDALWDSMLKALKTSARWHLALKWLGLLGVLVCTIGGGMDGGLLAVEPQVPTIKGLLVIIGGLVAAASSSLLLFVEWETPALMDQVRRQILETKVYLQERDQLAKLDKRRLALLQLHADVYEACENFPPDVPIQSVVQGMMDAGGIHLQSAIDVEISESWAFSVFQRQATGADVEEMVRIAVHWADRGSEQRGVPRTWPKQQGFTGWAWHDGDDLIVHDINDPAYAGRYTAQGDKFLGSDARRYISAAAIPIKVGADNEIWGCVTATSDQPGRFKRDPADVRSQNVETVRALARLIATQVAIRGGGA